MKSATYMFIICCFSLGAIAIGAEPQIVLFAGGGTDLADGVAATNANMGKPFGTEFTENGDAYIVEMTGQRVVKIDPTGKLLIVAGTGQKGGAGDGGPAAKAQFNGMHNLQIGSDGLIYLADTWNNKVRLLDVKAQAVRGFAGTGEKGFGGDGGPASKAKFGQVINIAFASDFARLYIADLDNARVRSVDMKTGTVITVAGNGGKKTNFKDGARATEVAIGKPRAVAADPSGKLYILHRGRGGPLQVVHTNGTIYTLLDNNNTGKPGPDGKKPIPLGGPKHLIVDPNGDVIIADTENHLVRKYIVKTGQVINIAGTGKRGSAGVPGPPLKAQLAQPHGVTLHRSGDLYISDSSNNRVLKIINSK